jgi:hypothetical protein
MARETRADRQQRLRDELAALEPRLQGKEPTEALPVGEVRIAFEHPQPPWRGLFGRLLDLLLGRSPASPRPLPRSIPGDGPRDIPSDTRRVPLHEGELVGELSCLYGTPRAATIAVTRACWMLELLRNGLESLYADPAGRARQDEAYKARVLWNHLRGLELFRDLSDEVFVEVRARVELCRFRDGDIICDQHDESDSMYVVRSGVVRVVQGVSSLLRPEDFADWPKLAGLLAGGPPAAGLRARSSKSGCGALSGTRRWIDRNPSGRR